jgi:hypothetical protein
MNDNHSEWFKLIDIASMGVVLGTIAGALPSIAALMMVVVSVAGEQIPRYSLMSGSHKL